MVTLYSVLHKAVVRFCRLILLGCKNLAISVAPERQRPHWGGKRNGGFRATTPGKLPFPWSMSLGSNSPDAG